LSASWSINDLLPNYRDSHSIHDRWKAACRNLWLAHERVHMYYGSHRKPSPSKLGPRFGSVTTLLAMLLRTFLPSYVPGITGCLLSQNLFCPFWSSWAIPLAKKCPCSYIEEGASSVLFP
jgi:hypothetical protein